MSYSPTEAALAGRLRLGRRIRQFRESRGYTQERLAHEAGFDRSFLVDLENGHHSCLLDRVFDLALALDVDVSELLSPLDVVQG